MKKAFLLTVALSMLFGCHNSNQNVTVTPEVVKTTDDFSFETKELDAVKVIDEEDFFGAVDIMVNAPVTENQALRDSICFWINECFGNKYEGDPRDLQAMIDFYKDQIFDEFTEMADGFNIEEIVYFVEANLCYVTYGFSTFCELDGAPRSSYEYHCVTFEQATGKRFSYKMLKPDETLENLVMNGILEQYFEGFEPEELDEYLFFDREDGSGFHLPYKQPWIENDSIRFGYDGHDIADRGIGNPVCGLPYDIMAPYLTEEGKSFFFTENELGKVGR